MTPSQAAVDVVDALVPLQAGNPTHAVRHQRDKVVAATQGSDDAIFDPALAGPSLAERLLAAHLIARLASSTALQAHYRARLLALPSLTPAQQAALDGALPEHLGADPRLKAILRFTRTLAERPVEGDKEALLRLPAAGLATPEVIALAQLIAFVSFQLRVIAGLQGIPAPGQDKGPAPAGRGGRGALAPPGQPGQPGPPGGAARRAW